MDNKLFWTNFPKPLAGVDEAGRGCLAGPVVAGAVILPDDYDLPLLTDSKRLSPAKRMMLAAKIREQALAFGFGLAWPEEIDRINILQASLAAMRRAVDCLRLQPAFVAVDGPHAMPDWERDFPQQAVIKADLLIPAVSAASILAKTFRDRLMTALDRRYPGYGLAGHKGYGARIHLAALRQLGPCPMHRLSFKGVKPPEDVQLCLPNI